MFCQYIFNKDGDIIEKIGGNSDVEIKSTNINDLFKEIGIKEKEWKLHKDYLAKCGDKTFRCLATKIGGNYQFIGFDISQYTELKEEYESQSRISDLNMNRLLKTLDDLRSENVNLKDKIHKKNKLISSTSHSLRTPLTDVLGLLELIEDTPKEEQSEYINIIRDSAKTILDILNELK